jgi:hypothetical protein
MASNIMDNLRSKIYGHFDDVGIKGQFTYSVVISFDEASLIPGINTPKKFILPKNYLIYPRMSIAGILLSISMIQQEWR